MINYAGHRRYLVSLSLKDFKGELSSKSFAVSEDIPAALGYIEEFSGIPADYVCLNNFVQKFFRDDCVDSDIVGDAPGAYSISAAFRLRGEDNFYCNTWMYLTITQVYFYYGDFGHSESSPRPKFVEVVCNSERITGDLGEKSVVIGSHDSIWDFYASGATVVDCFVTEIAGISSRENVRRNARDIMSTKDMIFSDMEKVQNHVSPCRNVPVWKESVKDKETDKTLSYLSFQFPVVNGIDGIATFKTYEISADHH